MAKRQHAQPRRQRQRRGQPRVAGGVELRGGDAVGGDHRGQAQLGERAGCERARQRGRTFGVQLRAEGGERGCSRARAQRGE